LSSNDFESLKLIRFHPFQAQITLHRFSQLDQKVLLSLTYKINEIIAMKNMKWIKLTLITLFMSGSFGNVTMAQQSPRQPSENQPWMRGLSEDQREQIKTLRLQTHELALGLENQLKEKKARLQTLSTGDQINAREAHSTIEQIAKLEGDLNKLRWDTRMEIRTLLTDEQKVIFDSFHSRQNERGLEGRMGVQGRQGQMRPQGRQGQMGPQNRKNHEGKQGPKGPQGRQGRHEANNGRGPVGR